MKLVLALLALVGSSMAMNYCEPCCVIVNFIKNEENREEPAEQAALDAACSKVTNNNAFLTKLCDIAVNAALNLLNEDFQKTPSGQICYDAKLCPTTSNCPNSVQQLFAAHVQPKAPAATPSQACSICEQVNGILTPIEQELPTVCKELEGVFPQLAGPCNQLISALPEVEQLVQLCEKYLCSSSAGSAKAAVDPCTIIAKAQDGLNKIESVCQSVPAVLKGLLKPLCEVALPGLQTAATQLAAELNCPSSAVKVAAPSSAQMCQVLQEVQTVLKSDSQFIINECVQIAGQSVATCQTIVDEITSFDTLAEGLLHCQQ